MVVSVRVVGVLKSLFGDEVQNSSQAFNRLNTGKPWVSGGQPPRELVASSFLEGAEVIPEGTPVLPCHTFTSHGSPGNKQHACVPKRTLRRMSTQSRTASRWQDGD